MWKAKEDDRMKAMMFSKGHTRYSLYQDISMDTQLEYTFIIQDNLSIHYLLRLSQKGITTLEREKGCCIWYQWSY